MAGELRGHARIMERVPGRVVFHLSISDEHWEELPAQRFVSTETERIIARVAVFCEQERSRARTFSVDDADTIPLHTITVEAYCVA